MGANGECSLVIVGMTPMGKGPVALPMFTWKGGHHGERCCWLMTASGLQAGPLLAVGDCAMSFWRALKEVFPATRTQRC